MLTIETLKENQFKLEDFQFTVGEYATYNSYFKLILQEGKTKINIGLQVVTGGIEPQAAIFNNKILIGAGDEFRVFDLKGNLINEYVAFPIFYQFIIQDNKILVVSELNVFLLNDNLDKIWEKEFNEIIDIDTISDKYLNLKDYNGKIIKLSMNSGKVID